jgi:hypothetical protein
MFSNLDSEETLQFPCSYVTQLRESEQITSKLTSLIYTLEVLGSNLGRITGNIDNGSH